MVKFKLWVIERCGYLIGGIAYLSVITQEQIFSDEYDLLGSGEGLSNHIRRDGRPAGAILYRGIAHFVNSPSDVFYLRLVSLLASILLLVLISREISQAYDNPLFKAFISVGIFLPVFVLYITWGMLSYFMVASVISFVAFKLWVTSNRKSKVVAFLLQIFVILIYPPSAFTSFALMGTIALISNGPVLNEVKMAWNWMVLNFTAGLSAVAIVFLDSNIRGYSMNSRVSILNPADVLEKAAWLFSRPIIISTRFFDIRSPDSSSAFITFLLFVLVFLLGLNLRHKSKRIFLYRLILFTGFIMLSLTPIAVSADNQFDYRLILGASISVYITFAFSILQIAEKYSKTIAPSLVLLIITFIVGLGSMYSHSTKLFTAPYIAKQQLIDNSLNECFLKNPQTSNILLIKEESEYAQRQNLGLFSMRTDMASEWVPIPSFKLVLKQMNLPEISVAWADSRTEIGPRDCQIDLSKFVSAFSN
jgi:hypothetical protein